MFQSFCEIFDKWTQVQTYGEADKSKYIQKKSSTIMTKYRDPPLVGIGAISQISECIRLKNVEEEKKKKTTIIKGQFYLFSKMIGSTIKF